MKKSKETAGKKTDGGFRINPAPLDMDATDFDAGELEPMDKDHGQEIDRLGELPRTYGANIIFLVAQEPHWLFTYWDIDISHHPGGPTFLRVFCGGFLESEIEVPFETRNWYIPVKEAGATYHVEIGFSRGGAWNAIATSQMARTPSDRLSESEAFQCATIPLHLNFESLLANLQSAMCEGEALLGALARLQLEGKLFPDGGGNGDDRTTVLRALLGQDFLDQLSSGALSSAQIESKIREALSEKLSSGGSSQFSLASALGGAESSFFGALGALSSGSSSWNVATLSSWATLASWAAQARASWGGEALSSETNAAVRGGQSSWSKAGISSFGGESGLSKAGISSFGGESSWAQAGLSSFGGQHLASWLGAIQSSWAQAALSSWNAQAFSSWSEAASTSWGGGGSENLSSFGSARSFFMHVNAEVIFYGGTDPRATVTVDGKPIKLASDGSFRYHFILPDSEYEVPIVATSPDGVETRRAVLRFERATTKVGGVDDTAQPPLGEPMGKVAKA